MIRGTRTARLVALAAAGLVTLVACGQNETGGGAGGPGASSAGEKTLTVYAAASLTDAFNELSDEFEAEHPGVRVTVNYGGSSGLAQQLLEGAPGDVFASADTNNMTKVTDAGLSDHQPQIFATNSLTVVVPADNPADITSFDDLQREGVSLVTCAPEVPCGASTRTVEEANGVDLKPVSEENAVTDVLGKVRSGQADAGIVYVTDADSAGQEIRQVQLPRADQAVNEYPVVTLRSSTETELAEEFVHLVTGERGQTVLREAGFGAP